MRSFHKSPETHNKGQGQGLSDIEKVDVIDSTERNELSFRKVREKQQNFGRDLKMYLCNIGDDECQDHHKRLYRVSYKEDMDQGLKDNF